MNRAERRRLAKSKSRLSFEKFMDVYKVLKDYEEIPEGVKVKIDRKKLEEKQSVSPQFQQWLDENSDRTFTVTYETASTNKHFVCLKEDKTEPKWLFWEGSLIIQEGKHE